MKKQMYVLLFAVLLLASGTVTIVAQEEEHIMPPMGAPDEIKALGWMVGDWQVDQKWRMDPNSDKYESSAATATYYYSLDSCVLIMDYKSEMMGMKFEGRFFETYDRGSKMYQTIWIDNMGARMSYYTGNKEEAGMVYYGDDYMPDGTKAKFRVSVLNATEKSFDWHMDFSFDGGKTYINSGKAKYTKK